MPSSSRHILGTFEDALNALKKHALMMASLTERSLTKAATGLFDRDDQLCNAVIADDQEIDQLEIRMDREGTDVLLRFHPVASDLRRVVASMKFSTDVERVADQAVNIARKARKLNVVPPLPETALIEPLYQFAFAMFRDSVQAYGNDDMDLARGLKARDKALDEMNARVANDLLDLMQRQPARVRDYIELLFIARHLERIGDHATNIAEEAVRAATAEEIRHQTPASE
jgi:phosphate transport system protein